MYRLLRIITMLTFLAGIILVVGVNVLPDSVGTAFLRPFCTGEVIRDEQFDTHYCVEGDNRRDMTGIRVAVPVALIFTGSMGFAFSFLIELLGMTLRYNNLLQNGEAGQARILAIHQTGVRVNSQPMLKFDLEVISGPGAPYQTSVRQVVNFLYLSQLSPGAMLNIKIDPQRPQKVAIDWNAGVSNTTTSGPMVYTSHPNMRVQTFDLSQGNMQSLEQVQDILQAALGTAPLSLKEKLQQLDEAKAAGLLTSQEYDSARQKLLEEFS
jgi:hypothetical protein